MGQTLTLANAPASRTPSSTVPGFERGKLLIRLAELIERDADELAAVESLDNGKAFSIARAFDVTELAANLRYYGGWADKNHGKVMEVNNTKLTVSDSVRAWRTLRAYIG